MVKNAYYMAAFLCGLNLFVGVLGYFLNIDFLTRMGFGWYNLVIGTLYFVPTLMGFKNKSWIILCFILAVFLLDTLNAFYWIIELNKHGEQINGGTLVMRFIFGVPLFLGAKAGFSMKDKEQEAL